MTLSIDTHEGLDLVALLKQLVPVTRDRLNDAGYADFLWADALGRLTTLEGKQAGELLASIDSVEEQLGRQIRAGKAHFYGLIIRGVALPHKDGIAVYQWQATKAGKPIAVESRVIRQSYKGYRAWLHRLGRMGVEVYEVPDTASMAIQLAAMYLSGQEEEHSTLQRHIVPRIQVMQPQDAVVSLMALQGAGIGEELALSLVGRRVDVSTGEITYAKYGSLWELFHADPADVAGTSLRSGKRTVGPAVTRKLFAALGRAD